MSVQDLNNLDGNPFKDKTFDVCICGSGPAGMTLAIKLSKRFKVCLLEAGGYDFREESQSLYKGDITGEGYADLDQIRFRLLGGSSIAWGGTCRPLDNYDFNSRDLVKFSGWPIQRGDIDPYLAEARDILNVNHENQETISDKKNDWLPVFGGYKKIKYWESSPRTNFGVKYRKFIENNENISCFLNANVTDITLQDGLHAVKHFEVTDYRDRKFTVDARKFVVAAGGIENPRILLNARSQINTGIGNKNGLVGRFFSEHPHHQLGEFILEDKVRTAFMKELQTPGTTMRSKSRYFSPSVQYMEQNRVLNHSLELHPSTTSFDPSVNDGFFKNRLRSLVCSSDYLRDIAETVKDGAVTCAKNVDGYVNISAEQEPNFESQVRLSDKKDRFGLQRADLFWYHSELDRRTVKEAALFAAKNLAVTRTGRVRLEQWITEEDFRLPGPQDKTASIVYGPHHMCSTRMCENPKTGVVDKNCKVFSNDNLYIAGSSVFSSGGFANPTFTIVQLALRLADHLDKQLTEYT